MAYENLERSTGANQPDCIAPDLCPIYENLNGKYTDKRELCQGNPGLCEQYVRDGFNDISAEINSSVMLLNTRYVQEYGIEDFVERQLAKEKRLLSKFVLTMAKRDGILD